MRSLIQVDHVQKYANSKIGNAWPISNLFLDPLPILAIRNQNDYDKHYTPKDRHSTFSWKRNWYLKYALEVAIPLLVRWQALRTGRKGIQDRLKSDLKDKAPNILLRFQNHARDLAIRRLSDVKPNQRYYGDFLLAV